MFLLLLLNCELEFYSKFFHARDKTNYIFLFFFTELKTYHLSYTIYKHDAEHDDIHDAEHDDIHDADAIDIVDLSSMQDAYRMNFVIHLAHRRVSVVEHLEHQRSEV